jgi:tetratricopeptide (TPR) repeat protein
VVGVVVTLEGIGTTVRLEEKTNKKGEFKLAVVDATKPFTLRLEKEGFAAHSEEVTIPVGQVLKATWTLGAVNVAAGNAAIEAFNAGVTFFNNGSRDEAIAKFEEARQLDPTIRQAHEVLAGLYIEVGRHDDALAAATAIEAIDPASSLVTEVRFDVAEAKSDRDGMFSNLDKLLAGSPNPSTARRAFNAGIVAARAQDDAHARRYLEAALALAPELPPVKPALMQVHAVAGRHDEALVLADAILATTPTDARAWTVRYQAYRAKGDVAKADEAWEHLFAANPEPMVEALLTEGRVAFDAGNNKRAVELFTRILSHRPDHPHANYAYGMAMVANGDIPAAKTYLKKFIELAPGDPEAATAKKMLAGL